MVTIPVDGVEVISGIQRVVAPGSAIRTGVQQAGNADRDKLVIAKGDGAEGFDTQVGQGLCRPGGGTGIDTGQHHTAIADDDGGRG